MRWLLVPFSGPNGCPLLHVCLKALEQGYPSMPDLLKTDPHEQRYGQTKFLFFPDFVRNTQKIPTRNWDLCL